jgi:integrase
MMTEGRNPKTGKLKRRSFYGNTRQEAAEKLNKALNELRTGTLVEPNKVKIGEWLDGWLVNCKKNSVRPITYASYEMPVWVHLKPCLGNILLRDLKVKGLQDFYNNKFKGNPSDGTAGLSSRTVRYLDIIMHEALDKAFKKTLIPKNIAEYFELSKQAKKEIRVFTRGELLALRWSDISFENRVVRVSRSLTRVKSYDGNSEKKTELIYQSPKTKSVRRSISIARNILYELKMYKAKQDEEKKYYGDIYEDNGLVFCTEAGKPIEPRNFNRKSYELIDKAKIPDANLHCFGTFLRHEDLN